MRLLGWRIDGFGALRDWTLEGLPDGLNLFHGPNEAGKTTLLAFLRFALFGFRPGNTRQPKYPPPAGLPHGGRLRLSTGEGEARDELEVERYAATAGGARRLRVRRPGGEEVDESELKRALGHVDRQLFSNVFAFSLGELQSLESLSAEGVQDHIFSAGITGAGRSARDALRRIQQESGELWKPGRGRSRIRELVEAIAEIDAELDRRREAARRYPELADEAAAMARQLAALRDEVASLRARERRESRLCEVWNEVWSPLEAGREALGKLELRPDFPADARLRLERLGGERAHRAEVASGLRDELESCAGALEALAPDAPALAVRERATRHRERAIRHDDLLEALPQAQQSLREADARLGEALANLGPGWDVSRLGAFDASLLRDDEALDWAERLAASSREREELERRARELAERGGRLERSLESARGERDRFEARPEAEIEAAILRLRRLRSGVLELDGMRARLSARRELAAERRAAGRDRVSLPVGLLLSALAIACYGALRFRPWLEARVGVLPLESEALQTGALALGLVALPILLLRVRERVRSHRALAAIEAGLAELAKSDSMLEAELASLAGGAGLIGVPGVGEIDAADLALERERDALRAWERHHEACRAVERECAEHELELDALGDVRAAQAEREDRLEGDWRAWKREAGLPDALSAASLPAYFDAVRRARERVDARDARRAELRRSEAAIEDWQRQARALLAGADEPFGEPDAGSAPARALREAFDALHRRCGEAEKDDARRRTLEERRRALEEKLGRAEARAARSERALAALFEATGVAGPEAFLALADEQEGVRALVAEIRRGEAELGRRLGRGEEADRLHAELASGRVADWEGEARLAREAAAEAENRRDEILRRHQDVCGAIEELERSAGLGELELERGERRQALADAAERWRSLRVAAGLLGGTLERFERERQPAVLQEASRYFRLVTGGRYPEILQSGADEGFRVLDAGGERRPPAELSRGTAEQLYVCIRLGLIAELARRGRRLPVVMDDVFVNFDDARALAMAEVLADFTRRNGAQVLVFTCSSRTRGLFERVANDARVWELDGPR